MKISIALLPLITPNMLIGIGLATRSFRQYYPLFAVLLVALFINIVLIVWHRKKQQREKE